MSVLIKGMKMPKNCDECSISDIRLCKLWMRMTISQRVEGKHPNCPLVEVPPHGDLVDRNNLLEKACYDYNEATHDYNHFRIVFEDDIINAPVVIEGNMDRSEVTE